MVKDLTGKQFGKLTVLSRASKEEVLSAGKKSNLDSAHWICKCSCGNIQIFRGNSLRKGAYHQCSSCAEVYRKEQLYKVKRISYKGLVNNRLTVLEDLDERDSQGDYLCLAQCSCGNIIKVCGAYIKNGNTKSCGCLKKETAANTAINRRIDLTGQVFGYLTVLGFGSLIKEDNYYYNTQRCKCICGKECEVKTTYLKLGEVTSCGCKTPEKLSLAKGGTGIPYEKLSTNELIRNLPRFQQWRSEVFKKYNYTCQISGIHGGDLVVHHIVPLNVLIKQYDITNENYMTYSDILFDLDNGIVLSAELHQQFHADYGYDTDNKLLLEFINTCNGVL